MSVLRNLPSQRRAIVEQLGPIVDMVFGAMEATRYPGSNAASTGGADVGTVRWYPLLFLRAHIMDPTALGV